MIVSSAAIMLSIAGRRVSAVSVVLATLTVAAGLVATRDVIARLIIGLLLRGAGEEPERSEPASIEIITLEDALEAAGLSGPENEDERLLLTFVLWSLIERIRQTIAPWIRRTVLLVHSHGLIYSVYPPEAEAELPEEALDLEVDEGVEALALGDTLQVWIDHDTYNTLIEEIASQGERLGEHVEVKSKRVLEALYTIAKKIYQAVNPTAPEELAAYTAYKTLIILEKKGIIKIPSKLRNTQLERKELWTRISKQLEEEEVEASKKNPNN